MIGQTISHYRVRILQKFVAGKTKVDIAREEDIDRETVRRIVRSPELTAYVEEQREVWRGAMLALGFPLGFFASGVFGPIGAFCTEFSPVACAARGRVSPTISGGPSAPSSLHSSVTSVQRRLWAKRLPYSPSPPMRS